MRQLLALPLALAAATLAACADASDPTGVAAAPTDRPLAAITSVVDECATPRTGWIFCDDFETSRISKYFEYDSAGGKFVRRAAVGHGNSYGMKVRYDSATVNAGSLKIAFGARPSSYFRPVDAGTAKYREIFWRVYLRTQAGWTGGGGYKLSRATIFANSSWAQAMIAHNWSGSSSKDLLAIDPASGTDTAGVLKTTKYNDMANLRWLGAARSVTPIFDAAHVGQWYCIEVHARVNDAGVANGVQEMWINDVLEARRANMNWIGRYSAYGINAVFLENYWNAPGSPKRQERYLDRFVVSTQRIGC
jgi:hypothetical protein